MSKKTRRKQASRAESALNAMLRGVEVTTRLPYETWAQVFWQRWRATTVLTNDAKARINEYVLERELDLDSMTVFQAYGLYAHHPLKFMNEAHLADYVRDQEHLPVDSFQPLDNDDLNRIEHEEWIHTRTPGRIQIDMGRDR